MQAEAGEFKKLNMDSQLPRRRVVFAWDMHYSCNYRCPYCWYTVSNWTELGKKNDYRGGDEWVKAWTRMHELYGRCQIRITAGEPFTYPKFAQLVGKLSRLHDIQITSNCSYGEAMREFAQAADPKRVELDCTFHPIWGEFEPFVENVLMLRKNGFLANVCYLAYPPQMPQMGDFKKKFADKGVYMNMAIFWGQHEGKQYPFAYTAEEKRWIKDVIGSEVSPETVNLEPLPINGKVCGAGQRYAVVHADGRVYRCGQLARDEQCIGDIFNPEFKLSEKGKECTVDFCRSKEYQSAWEDEERVLLDQKNEVRA